MNIFAGWLYRLIRSFPFCSITVILFSWARSKRINRKRRLFSTPLPNLQSRDSYVINVTVDFLLSIFNQSPVQFLSHIVHSVSWTYHAFSMSNNRLNVKLQKIFLIQVFVSHFYRDPLWDNVSLQFHLFDHSHHLLECVLWAEAHVLIRHDLPALAASKMSPNAETQLLLQRVTLVLRFTH